MIYSDRTVKPFHYVGPHQYLGDVELEPGLLVCTKQVPGQNRVLLYVEQEVVALTPKEYTSIKEHLR